MAKSIIAVLRIPFEDLGVKVEGEADGGFSRVRALGGAEGTFDARGQGGATIIRVADVPDEAEVALVLRALLGDALDRHDDERGVFVAKAEPEGERYDELVSGEGEFVKPEKAGLTADAEDRILSLLEKRSSRAALAAKLSADLGDRDAGAVVDADDAEKDEDGDVARLHAALDRKFAGSKLRGELDEDLRDTIEAPPEEDEEPPRDETTSQ